MRRLGIGGKQTMNENEYDGIDYHIGERSRFRAFARRIEGQMQRVPQDDTG